jgi:hypothetical protein
MQMPFTTEQMRKLGSVELYNTFKDEHFYKVQTAKMNLKGQ